MNSDLPKVLQRLAGKLSVKRVIDAARDFTSLPTAAAACCLALALPVARAESVADGVALHDIRELAPLATLHLGKTADWVALETEAVWVGSTAPFAVHRIDPLTNTRVATVSLPGEPCAGIALGFGSVWIPLCKPSSGLARVDAASNRLVARYALGKIDAECGITTSPDAVWLISQNALLRVVPASGKIAQRIVLPRGACNPRYADGIVWVTHAAGAELIAVDAAGGKILGSTRVHRHPRFLAVGAKSVWTLNQGDGSLSQVIRRTRQVAHTTVLGTPGHGGDIAYHEGYVWTTMFKIPLSLTDAATGRLRCQLTGTGGDSLEVDGDALWLTDYRGGNVARYAVKDVLRHCGLQPVSTPGVD